MQTNSKLDNSAEIQLAYSKGEILQGKLYAGADVSVAQVHLYNSDADIKFGNMKGGLGVKDGTVSAKAGFDMVSVSKESTLARIPCADIVVGGGLSAGSLKIGGEVGLSKEEGAKIEIEGGVIVGVKVSVKIVPTCGIKPKSNENDYWKNNSSLYGAGSVIK
jgi:hypothetical protein